MKDKKETWLIFMSKHIAISKVEKENVYFIVAKINACCTDLLIMYRKRLKITMFWLWVMNTKYITIYVLDLSSVPDKRSLSGIKRCCCLLPARAQKLWTRKMKKNNNNSTRMNKEYKKKVHSIFNRNKM